MRQLVSDIRRLPVRVVPIVVNDKASSLAVDGNGRELVGAGAVQEMANGTGTLCLKISQTQHANAEVLRQQGRAERRGHGDSHGAPHVPGKPIGFGLEPPPQQWVTSR